MLWGCFSVKVTGQLICIKVRMHRETLDKKLTPSVRALEMKGVWILGILKVLKCHNQSPNFNPIENSLRELKVFVGRGRGMILNDQAMT